jgi:uncharacterized membrane-anchored protein
MSPTAAPAALPAKLPQVTAAFWVMKIAATTLGETAGDLMAQTLRIGYLASSVILVGLLAASLMTQLRVRSFHPALYWLVILLTSTAGTTMSDFMNRTAGLGYADGSAILVTGLAVVFAVWRVSGHPFDVRQVRTLGGELLYWAAILFSNTLGTSMGDFLSDSSGLGFRGAAFLVAGVMLLVVAASRVQRAPKTLLFWVAFVLTRPLGASVGDTFSKPVAKGGLGYGTQLTSAVLVAVLVAMVGWTYARGRRRVVAV